MSVALRALPSDDESVGDQFVYLRGATWSDYERLYQIRSEKAVPRLTFDEGFLELMSPSNEHEQIAASIGRFVEAWCDVHGLDFSCFGSWTLKNKKKATGVEPDECYVFGELKKRRPDLAIEVIWTSGGIDKRDLYRKFGVPELWFWRRGRFHVYVRRARGYQEVPGSELLPGIDLPQLLTYIDRFPTSRAVRAYRRALTAKRRA
jgi:Uma2 family endonuclease